MVDKHIRFPPLFCCVCPSHSVTDKRSGLPIGGAEQQKIHLLRLLIQQFSTNSKRWVYSRRNLMRLLHLNANMIRVLRTNNTKPFFSPVSCRHELCCSIPFWLVMCWLMVMRRHWHWFDQRSPWKSPICLQFKMSCQFLQVFSIMDEENALTVSGNLAILEARLSGAVVSRSTAIH